MKKREIYNFNYKGFTCEIVHWRFNTPDTCLESLHPTGNWNYYIYIKRDQLSDEDWKKLRCKNKPFTMIRKRNSWDYYKLEDYFHFHGGITYYELLRDEFNGRPFAVKVGCDYMHSFDDNIPYDLDMVKLDTKKSVDVFIKHFPDYKVWDVKDGEYRKLEELLGNNSEMELS